MRSEDSAAVAVARTLTTPAALEDYVERLLRAVEASDIGPVSGLVEALVTLGANVSFGRIEGEGAKDVLVTIIRQPLILQANGETVEDALALAAQTLADMGGMS